MKKVLLNVMFLLCALIVGIGNVWAIENYNYEYYKWRLVSYNMLSGNYDPNNCDPTHNEECRKIMV